MVAHIPVLLTEVLAGLEPKDGAVYVDGTFGAGGYTRAILSAATCHVIAIDRDETTRKFAEPLLKEFGARFTYIVGNFSDMCALLEAQGIHQVDGVVLDLGISSMQVDNAERGFSFKHDGPLDMRMSGAGVSAADIVNRADEKELAHILYHYGEEKASRRIAKAIVEARKTTPITRTSELRNIVAKVVYADGKKDPATRTFQALRIEVNQELKFVEQGLVAAEKILKPSGKLLVVSFHSLEDRMVKQFMHERAGKNQPFSRHLPMVNVRAPSFTIQGKCVASEEETTRNPRSRSATLRIATRTDAPEWRAAV